MECSVERFTREGCSGGAIESQMIKRSFAHLPHVSSVDIEHYARLRYISTPPLLPCSEVVVNVFRHLHLDPTRSCGEMAFQKGISWFVYTVVSNMDPIGQLWKTQRRVDRAVLSTIPVSRTTTLRAVDMRVASTPFFIPRPAHCSPQPIAIAIASSLHFPLSPPPLHVVLSLVGR